MEHLSGGEIVIRALKDAGVKHVWGYPGGAALHIYDALYRQEDVEHLLVRHEQAAVHAADGFSRSTGEVGTALVTSGPGATNAITGIATAYMDSTPIVVISGQVKSGLIGTDSFQETDMIGVSRPIVKHSFLVQKAEEIPEIIKKAFHIATTGRPGPVVIDIPKDFTDPDYKFDYSYPEEIKMRSYNPPIEGDPKRIIEAADLIESAQRPVIYSGGGVIQNDASDELTEFAKLLNFPVTNTLMGLGAFPGSDPQFMGMLGMHGNYGPNMLTNECDVLITIGMRFDDRVTGNLETYAKQAKVIHFEIDPAEIDKNVKTTVAVLGDAKVSLRDILPLINENSHKAWLEEFHKYYEIEYNEVIKNDIYPTKPGLTMGEAIRILNEKSGNKAVIVTDVGQHQMIACRYAGFSQTKSNVTSGGLGTMGFALPAAIGAKMGAPDREVVAIIGDGGYQMTIQELGTIFQNKTAVKIMVLNNEHLGMVRQWQELFFESRYSSTVMSNPDFVKIAAGYDIEAARVSERDQLAAAIEKMMAHEGPYFLEVCVENEHNVFPMIPTGASVSDIRLK